MNEAGGKAPLTWKGLPLAALIHGEQHIVSACLGPVAILHLSINPFWYESCSRRSLYKYSYLRVPSTTDLQTHPLPTTGTGARVNVNPDDRALGGFGGARVRAPEREISRQMLARAISF